MKNKTKQIKSILATVTIILAGLIAGPAQAIYEEDGYVYIYKSKWSEVENLCQNVNCVEVVSSGSGYMVKIKP